MEKLEKYTNALSTLTYFINTSIISDIIDRTETEEEEPLRFFYTILLKSNNGLDTCSLLLANFSSRPHHVDSLIVILRSLISDCVIFRYLLVKSEHDNDKLKAFIKSLYFDHIHYTVSGLEKYFKDIYGFANEEIQNKINEIKTGRPDFYDSAGKPLVKHLSTSVRFALQEMAKKITDPVERYEIQLFYHHYDIYSKYEHLGEFSYKLIHQQYREETRYKLADELVQAINGLIIPTMISTLGAWPDIHTKHKNKFNALFTSLVNSYQ